MELVHSERHLSARNLLLYMVSSFTCFGVASGIFCHRFAFNYRGLGRRKGTEG